MFQIAVIGNDDCQSDSREFQLAYEIGSEIATLGALLVCGGGTGIMEAACRGAKDHGGITLGVLPAAKKKPIDYLDIQIPTGLDHARNVVVILSADIIVAIGGKAGTLSEICFAWITGKPIIALSVVEGWSARLAGRCLDDRRTSPIYSATTVLEVVQIIEAIQQQ
ncbi:MAG: TIGR00725 family protein [Promethearchaeota archaeon]